MSAAHRHDRGTIVRKTRPAVITLIRKGWGRGTPAFRQIVTSKFFLPDANPALVAHFNELQRLSADPETAARYHESCHQRGDGRELYQQLKIPTLIIHSREDLAVSADEGDCSHRSSPAANSYCYQAGRTTSPPTLRSSQEPHTRSLGSLQGTSSGGSSAVAGAGL
jgi:pimeloyl-ACP methyl ester carboxylesterase